MTIQGLGFFDPGQLVRLSRIAEDRTRPEQDRRLDAAIFLCRLAAGRDAGYHHHRHDALSHRCLKSPQVDAATVRADEVIE